MSHGTRVIQGESWSAFTGLWRAICDEDNWRGDWHVFRGLAGQDRARHRHDQHGDALPGVSGNGRELCRCGHTADEHVWNRCVVDVVGDDCECAGWEQSNE